MKNLATSLTQWFKKNARTLPWRSNPEPYAVWISEIMLQQTQVTAVLPYYARFMKSFPTVASLANAKLDDVYKHWAGLGYYSRARNLHAGAKIIHAAKALPKNRAEWLEIPGVGEYTAGAICSIALNQREAIVDGNVERVVSRIFGIKKRDPKRVQIWDLARELVQFKEPRQLNQSLMELGALICKPKNPDCTNCPASAFCKGKSNPLLYPAPKPKKIWKCVQESKAVLISDQKVFLIKNNAEGWREGLWDFPESVQSLKIKSAQVKLKQELVIRYVVTNHKVKRTHQVFEVSNKDKVLSKAGEWFLLNQLPGVPAPVKKAVLALQSRK